MGGVPVRSQAPAKEKAEFADPLRACLFGIPGSGKSTCIKHLRSFFSEALGWEDGVEFQFLAFQNTMAALIGGQTLHHWGGIPVHIGAAEEKTHAKGADGDVDGLFERVLACRFLVIDEVSLAGLQLLGLLDSYLRRVCSRHPLARRDRAQLPFGGLNIIFAGDLWQLPPVNERAIFSNPFQTEESAGQKAWSPGEKKIAAMFWMTEAPMQHVFLLTHSHRTKDPWLREVLQADRFGQESWEMYCFTHGLPTRHPGSWLPSRGGPTCGTATCATLVARLKWK